MLLCPRSYTRCLCSEPKRKKKTDRRRCQCTITANMKWNEWVVNCGLQSALVAPPLGSGYASAKGESPLLRAATAGHDVVPPIRIAYRSSPLPCSISNWRSLYATARYHNGDANRRDVDIAVAGRPKYARRRSAAILSNPDWQENTSHPMKCAGSLLVSLPEPYRKARHRTIGANSTGVVPFPYIGTRRRVNV